MSYHTNVLDTMTLGLMGTVTRLDIAPPLELQKFRVYRVCRVTRVYRVDGVYRACRVFRDIGFLALTEELTARMPAIIQTHKNSTNPKKH
jgi:hypothetical protein